MATVVSNNLNILIDVILNKGWYLVILYSQTSLSIKNKITQKKKKKKKHLIQKIALKQDSYFNLIANILKFLP